MGFCSSGRIRPTKIAFATRREPRGRKWRRSTSVKKQPQRGIERDSEHRRDDHRECLSVGERPEHPAFLRLRASKTGRNETAITSSAKKLGPATSLTAAITTSR